MQIPNIVYLKFYEVIKCEFVKRVKVYIEDFEDDGDYKFWFKKVLGEKNDTYFASFFKKVTTNPKHFYYKFNEAENDISFHPAEKDDLLIYVLESFLGLQYPKQCYFDSAVTNSTKDEKRLISKKASVLLQVFIESYAPTLFLNYPNLKVFDRLTESFLITEDTEPKLDLELKEILVDHIGATALGIKRIEEGRIKVVVHNFFWDLGRRQYEQAFDLCLFDKNEAEKRGLLNPLTVANLDFEIGKILIDGDVAYCGVVYTELAWDYSSPTIKLIKNAKLKDIGLFFEEVRRLKWSLEEAGLSVANDYPLSDLFYANFTRALYNEADNHLQQFEKLFPKKSLCRIRRYQINRLEKRDGSWKIDYSGPKNINIARKTKTDHTDFPYLGGEISRFFK